VQMHCHANLNDIHAIKSNLNSWGHLSPEEFQFERLAGLSNEIWKVTALSAEANPKSIIFRRFGEGSCVVDREKEDYILKGLSKNGVGPKIYAGSDKFRIEKYLESDTLNPAELEKVPVRRQLAKCLAELHNVHLPELDKTPLFERILDDRKMIRKAEEKANRSVYTSEDRRILEKLLSLTKDDEITFLRKILPQGPKSVVLSHNDLHSQNVLNLKENNKLVLIDFEYADYNYRGYDIANVFNEGLFEYDASEHPFYRCDESKYPTHQELFDFVKYYLFFYKFEIRRDETAQYLEDEDELTRYIQQHHNLDEFIEEVEEIIKEVKACSLFSHYYWILWSIIMSKNNNGNLDHLHYAQKRLEIYQGIKRKYFGGRRASKTNKQSTQGQERVSLEKENLILV